MMIDNRPGHISQFDALPDQRPKDQLRAGDLVQMGPKCGNPAFKYCIMVVTDVRQWGVQGYFQAIGTRASSGGVVPYREEYDKFTRVGRAAYIDGMMKDD